MKIQKNYLLFYLGLKNKTTKKRTFINKKVLSQLVKNIDFIMKKGIFFHKIFYNTNNFAILKNTINAILSTNVEIKGPAIIAGSNFIIFANIGSKHPTHFATTTTRHILTETVKSTQNVVLLLNNVNLNILILPSNIPQITPTLNSFHITLNISFVSISPFPFAYFL